MHRSGRRAVLGAMVVGALVLAACSDDDDDAGGADGTSVASSAATTATGSPDTTEEDTGSSAPPSDVELPPECAEASGEDLTDEQLQWSVALIGGEAGPADFSLPPVAFGYVNQEGGTLSFPEATAAMEATVLFINCELGGVAGHPIESRPCLAAAPNDSLTCGTQMANDDEVRSIVVPLMLLNNEAFYNALGGEKPVLAGGLFLPVDLTAPSVYTYSVSAQVQTAGVVLIAQELDAQRLVIIRTDNPAGAAATEALLAIAEAAGLPAIEVPVPEPGTAPTYSAAISAADLQPGDVVQLNITAIGATTVYDTLEALGLTDIAVLGGELQALPPMPGHLEDLGLPDTVFPNDWYLVSDGYTSFMPAPDSNGTDVFVAMMAKYAPDAPSLYGYAPTAFGQVLAMARFLTEAGGPDATAEQLDELIRTWEGPGVMSAGPLACGAFESSPNLCQFGVGLAQRQDGEWVSIADGLNGEYLDTLPFLQETLG